MTRFSIFLAGAAMSLALSATAQETTTDAEAPAMIEATADTVLATVNGQDITLGHVIVIRAGLPPEYQNLGEDVLLSGILDQLIQQAAVNDTDGDELPKRARVALENEKRTILAGQALEAVANSAVTDEALQAAYDARYADAPVKQEYNASHILVETEEEARELVEMLAEGADFAELAKEKSTGPSGPNGGLLGWFGEGAMVPSFEAAVIALAPGEVSAPVQTQFGWHVIKMNEVRDLPGPSLDDVRDELAGEIREEAVRAHVDARTAAADITRLDLETIDPAVVTRTDLLDE
ncbi:peptidylprolyl isomerase [Pseudaestuariivita atlantica]|uniref:Parvulin-like PPIase n=1 Tax=Pseudaestuariivita atlantica TaxID=1317121 RepID=A0A0L1JPK2_9RHOB|nr:peptidylprolyl isomerase [Pseudaestuariivita atlantica]KNG93333.1 peptidylprolyl isomerase [Pseudaestuariivita atlantica]